MSQTPLIMSCYCGDECRQCERQSKQMQPKLDAAKVEYMCPQGTPGCSGQRPREGGSDGPCRCKELADAYEKCPPDCSCMQSMSGSSNTLFHPNLTGDTDFDDLLKNCINILQTKGDDYTIGTNDRLHNFKTVGEFTGMTPEQSLGVYLYKHVSAIFAYIKKGGQSESEPIEGRITDVINYMLLFHKMVKARKRGELK